ncbi:fungal-specific transcription factor domain-containing protein [Mariannaea sp. PMI_226]|nr:fungal-specific transcription factor domain-containing protein [Mariannaea sp. PMI_226]
MTLRSMMLARRKVRASTITLTPLRNRLHILGEPLCDACRTRKIRCDRNSPCSHCVHAKIPCTHADTRPKEKRTRILLSAQYERKIDLIDRRLEGVTRLLQEMRTSMPTSGPQPVPLNIETPIEKPPQSASSATSTPFGHIVQPASDSPVVEGESSLAAHSVFANEFLQKAVRIDSLPGASLELRDTIDSLYHIVEALKQQTAATEMSYTMANQVPRPTLPGIKLPPIQKIIALIRGAKTERSELGVWLFELAPLEDFSEICMGVYFSQDYSEADFIIANAGMHSLLWESAYAMADSEEKEEELSYVRMCRTNLETALSALPLHLPANPSMISALLLGAYHAIEISKPSLCWSLTSKAGELCQTLGYHRLSSMKNDKMEEKRRKLFLFWSIYFMDKSLSLRLGRASTIPDWDISVPMPRPDDFKKSSALSAFVVMWIWTARCQGNIYEKLYSPDAVSQSDHVRKTRVDAIVKTLEEIRVQTNQVSAQWLDEASAKIGNEMVEFITISDDVLRLSLLTLAYRASPPPPGSRTPFVPECIEAARATLQRHQDCMAIVQNAHALYFHSYIHWTLLFAPFTPFIVLFCQVIETQDERDLASMHNFITSTESAPTVSEAAAKMCRLFQVLYSVAIRYIEFRTSTPPADQTQANAELNTYLTALGFPPVGPEQPQDQRVSGLGQSQPAFGNTMGGGGVLDQNPMMWMGNTAQLEDWFNSNQQMMELLEEPSFSFPQ